MIEEHQKPVIMTKKTSKNYLIALIFLALAICAVFLDIEFFNKIFLQNPDISASPKKSENILNSSYVNHTEPNKPNNMMESNSDNINVDTEESDLVAQEKIKSVDYNDLALDLPEIIMNIYSNVDCSKSIYDLKIALCKNECPSEIIEAIESIQKYNTDYIINNKSNVIFPNKNNFLNKILLSMITIEKIDFTKIQNQEIMIKNFASIMRYISQLQRSAGND
jgi:hypothetical protein